MGVVEDQGVLLAFRAHDGTKVSVGRSLPTHELKLAQRPLQGNTGKACATPAQLEACPGIEGSGFGWKQQCLGLLATACL